jgi:4-hydroxybenzoate polyprenyltransferase
VNKPIKFSIDVALIVAGIAGSLLLLALIVYGYVSGQRWVGVAHKSLWDWLKLLIVPVVLAIAGFVISDAAQRERDRDQSERQAAADLVTAYSLVPPSL